MIRSVTYAHREDHDWGPDFSYENATREVDALIASVREEVLAWRPIETAPKDVAVLVQGPDYKYPFVAMFNDWMNQFTNPQWKLAGSQNQIFYGLSHWMPLPPVKGGS